MGSLTHGHMATQHILQPTFNCQIKASTRPTYSNNNPTLLKKLLIRFSVVLFRVEMMLLVVNVLIEFQITLVKMM